MCSSEHSFCLPSFEPLFPSRSALALSSPRLRKPISLTSTRPQGTNSKPSLALAMPTQKKSSRVVRTSGMMSWCRRRFFREQLTRGSNTRLWRSRNSLFYAARIRFSGIDRPTLRAIWSERPAELLIPPGEGDAELCPNEKMVVDESRFFNVHGCGGIEKSFQSHPVI